METDANVVIIGAGQAGVELASTLRTYGFSGCLTVIGNEAVEPYQRPPLSKNFITSGGDVTPLILRAKAFYADRNITLMLDHEIIAIDRQCKSVTLNNGTILPYDHLVLATGTRNRKLPIPGLDHADVLELRTLKHAQNLLGKISKLRRVAIIGGGFIGLEIASLLRAKNIEVSVIETADRIMERVVSADMSAYFQQMHTQSGVCFHLGQQVTKVEHLQAVCCISLRNGLQLQADAIMLAAGVVPNVELADAAGLATDNGIVVDQTLVSSDPNISAIGDCAAHPNKFTHGRVRVESVQNAVDQAKCVARRLSGAPQCYDALPWFWSVQGAARLQIAGLAPNGCNDVIRNPGEGKFAVYRYSNKRLVAVETVNMIKEHMQARKILAAGQSIAPDMVPDLGVALVAH